MSRSNPTDNAPNPCHRWFEWKGESGIVRYYDKEQKQNIDVPLPFRFLLLDEVATVQGWHDASQSGIYANEVRDTRTDILIVKAFKGGTLAEGLYQDIKDRVHTVGGRFNANLYVAYKNGSDGLDIGAVRFKGAALGAWMEFRKAHRSDLMKKAVEIIGATKGKKGSVTFYTPSFKLVETTAESHSAAVALDAELQTYLKAYLSRTKRDQADTAPLRDVPEPMPTDADNIAPDEDSIPF